MNARERLYLALFALLLGGAGVGLGVMATALVPLEYLRTSLDTVHGNIGYLLVALGLLAVAVALLVVSLRRGECVETIVRQGSLGELRVCFKAVETLVLKAASDVKGIRDTKTRIVQSDGGLVIFLRAATYPDQNIPQVTAELQGAVKDYVENTTGSKVTEVKVMIENVVTDTARAVR